MSNKTRNHIWPVSLIAALGIVAVLALMAATVWMPGPAQAQDGPSNPFAAPPPGTMPTGPTNPFATPSATPAVTMLESSSNTGSAGVKLTLTIDLEQNLTGSSWVEIYLEDDYQEPGFIARENVIFEARGTPTTGGSRVDVDTTFAAAAVEIDDGGTILNPDGDDDEDVVVISARIPDMKDGDATGYPKAGQTLIMVVSTDAGIKNPSEAGSHSVGYSIIGGTDDRADEAGMKLSDLKTVAKISLSDDDGGRGKEVTITGSGFNNGVDAEAFVLVKMTGDAPDCQTIINDGDSLGTAGVDSDDKFAIVFTVHQDEFKPGNVNYICAEDSEAGNPRQASAVKPFDLTASISLDPAEANSGDEVTLKARDFGGALTSISLGPDNTWTPTADATDTGYFPIKEITNNNKDYTFDVPGGLSGVIQVSAKRDSTRKTANLTITPSSLTLNQTEVAPNQSIIISGSGFSDRAEILTSKITIDGKMLKVDDAGTEGTSDERHVSITSSGQFTVTVNVWHDGAGNPALDADEYTIKVTDSNGYEGKTKITISEPTVMVTPQVAGPRDFITISGANWPVSTSEDDYDVSIEVDDKRRSASIDSSGRFNYEYRLSGGIGIGEEHDVKVTFTSAHGDKIEEETTFSVPSSNVVITPAAAALVKASTWKSPECQLASW